MNLDNALFIKNTAVDFLNIGLAQCDKIFLPGLPQDGTLYIRIVAPATILSFAIELLLKAILRQRNQTILRTHKLSELYKDLPLHARNKIKAFYNKVEVDETRFTSIRFRRETDDSTDPEKSSDELEHQLDLHDDSFVRWRYVFEFPHDNEEILEFNFAFAIKFAKALYRYTNEVIIP